MSRQLGPASQPELLTPAAASENKPWLQWLEGVEELIWYDFLLGNNSRETSA